MFPEPPRQGLLYDDLYVGMPSAALAARSPTPT